MARSLAKEPMVFDAEDTKVNRPSNRLSFDDIVQERQAICKEIDNIKLQIADIKKRLLRKMQPNTEDQAFDKREEKAILSEKIKELSKELNNIRL